MPVELGPVNVYSVRVLSKPTMATKWGEDVTCKFVCEYYKNECLWNFKLDTYKNQEARLVAYAAIARAMNIPNFGISEVKYKIKNLRSTYNQEKRKMLVSIQNGSDHIYKPSVKWYNEMSKVMDIEDNRKTDKGFKAENTIIYKPEPVDVIYTNVEEILEKPEEDIAPYETTEDDYDNSNSTRTFKRGLEDIIEVPGKRHRPNVKEKDEFDYFGAHIASQLRLLPLQEALKIQIKIQEMIMKERMQQEDCETNISLHGIKQEHTEWAL